VITWTAVLTNEGVDDFDDLSLLLAWQSSCGLEAPLHLAYWAGPLSCSQRLPSQTQDLIHIDLERLSEKREDLAARWLIAPLPMSNARMRKPDCFPELDLG
jgi:hypothetical protein